MSQRIAAYRVKDLPVLVLVGGSAGHPVRGMGVFVADRNGHSSGYLNSHLDHAVGVEKRNGRCFDQFSQGLQIALYQKVFFCKMLFADVHPEADPS